MAWTSFVTPGTSHKTRLLNCHVESRDKFCHLRQLFSLILKIRGIKQRKTKKMGEPGSDYKTTKQAERFQLTFQAHFPVAKIILKINWRSDLDCYDAIFSIPFFPFKNLSPSFFSICIVFVTENEPKTAQKALPFVVSLKL